MVESEHDYENTNGDEDSLDGSDSDEFEDEESEDEDYGMGMGVSNERDPFEAIPDIAEHLKKLKLEYKHHTLNGDDCPPRTFYKLFTEWKGIPNANASALNPFDYPHKQRLCIVVDRRRDDTEIFMYEPDIEKEFPRNYVDEWYFESSSKCLIPGKGQKDCITARDSCNGYLFNLSFHVEAIDVIRCYLYTRASIIRFFPEDVYKLLPELFDMTRNDNESFVRTEKERGCNGRIKDIKLKDSLFESFRSQTSDEYIEISNKIN